jgi:serine/threonine protein kinase
MTTEARGGEAAVRAPRPQTVGRYRLVQQIGEGGMGVVHLALDPSGRAVALKLLRPHIALDEDARTRLAREVDILGRVQDPRVAAVLDADLDGERPFVVTRYVPGPSLDEVVRERGPMRGPDLYRLGSGLAGALDAIHAAGVVHRDLKPANVLLLDGDPVVIDFGIAHVADDVRLTMTGLVMGTPG